jgi:hypothetical protein
MHRKKRLLFRVPTNLVGEMGSAVSLRRYDPKAGSNVILEWIRCDSGNRIIGLHSRQASSGAGNLSKRRGGQESWSRLDRLLTTISAMPLISGRWPWGGKQRTSRREAFSGRPGCVRQQLFWLGNRYGAAHW